MPPRERALWKRFTVFLVPMLLANVLQSLSGTLNNVYVGQMLGVNAMAAVSSFFPVTFFFIAFVIGLGSGSSVLIGQAWGAGEVDRARAIAGTTLCVTLVFGALIAVFGGLFTDRMLAALGTPADILPDATRYARIMLVAMPGMFVFLLATSMLRGVGDSLTPMYTLLISTVVGLLMTPALIRGWLGLAPMGVVSAAWGTVIAFVVALLWMNWHLRRKASPLAPDAAFFKHLRIDWQLLRGVLRVGIPSGVQMIVVALSELVLLALVNDFGSGATAAYGAVNQVVAYVQFPAISIAIATSILGAQAIGAGQTERLSAITRTAIVMNLVFTGSLVLLGYLFSRPLMSLFITDPEVIEVAQHLLHVMLWSLLLFGIGTALSGTMRASGTVLVPTAISIFAILVVSLPVGWVMSRHIGLAGVWLAYPASFGCMLLLQASYYHFVWRKKPIHRLV